MQYLGELKADLRVVRNDEVTLDQIRELKPERILVSPGPCSPREAGLSNDIIRTFGPHIPLFGVCLGHQCIGHSFGGEVVVNYRMMHGKTSPVLHTARGVFAGLPSPFTATRYHSLAVEREDGRWANRSLLIAPDGSIAARYDKIHMFDVQLATGESWRESAAYVPGEDVVAAPTPLGLLGLTICYDLRFPSLYRALAEAGASFIAIPAAFTKQTGEAHWHTLMRARAIENGAYVIAPCQYGTLAGGSACFGHSLIVDPWGRVLADGGEAEGGIVAEIDLDLVRQTRSRIPSLRHDRAFA